MNKVLNNYNKSKRISGTSKGKIGIVLHLMDKNKERLSVGDTVRYGEYQGVLLYNHHYDKYGIALDYSMWYGDDKYNIDSYGKFVDIPMDNGARMEIEKLGWGENKMNEKISEKPIREEKIEKLKEKIYSEIDNITKRTRREMRALLSDGIDNNE